MRKNVIFFVLVLGACAKQVPVYTYENAHIIDEALQGDDVCIIIDNDKTNYEKGVERLSTNPFLGEEGYSADFINKSKREYDYAFVNDTCKNPINISRNIKVSGIVYPGTCTERVYAGSVYTGSTTYSSGYGSANMIGNSVFGSYSGTSNTYVNSIPVYNTHRYACIKENYLTEIEFYKDKKYLGKIRNKYWDDTDADYTIDVFTEEFIKLLNKKRDD